MMLNGVFWTNINLMGWFWIPALVLIWGRIARLNKEFTAESAEDAEKEEGKEKNLFSFFLITSARSAFSAVSLGVAGGA